MLRSKVFKFSFVAFVGLIFFILFDDWIPTSLDEYKFIKEVSTRLVTGTDELRLPDLMLGDWELVCESLGYDGPLYLKQYNKTYSPVAPPQDGVWGLIFISKDGSYKSASGSCRSTKALLRTNGCAKREKAILIKDKDYSSECPIFDVENEH
jgi:hypothetical protein